MTESQDKTVSFQKNISVDSFGSLADATIRQALEEIVQSLGGDAGAIWIVEPADPENLVIAVNVGSRGSSIEGEVSQNVDSGLVSKAFREGKIVHDQGAFQHPDQSAQVDQQLGQYTAYQVAAPFSMFANKIGAVTIVQLSDGSPKRQWGFTPESVESLQRWLPAIERLFEYAVITQ